MPARVLPHLHFYNVPVVVEEGHPANPLSIIKQIYQPGDFVVRRHECLPVCAYVCRVGEEWWVAGRVCLCVQGWGKSGGLEAWVGCTSRAGACMHWLASAACTQQPAHHHHHQKVAVRLHWQR